MGHAIPGGRCVLELELRCSAEALPAPIVAHSDAGSLDELLVRAGELVLVEGVRLVANMIHGPDLHDDLGVVKVVPIVYKPCLQPICELVAANEDAIELAVALAFFARNVYASDVHLMTLAALACGSRSSYHPALTNSWSVIQLPHTMLQWPATQMPLLSGAFMMRVSKSSNTESYFAALQLCVGGYALTYTVSMLAHLRRMAVCAIPQSAHSKWPTSSLRTQHL